MVQLDLRYLSRDIDRHGNVRFYVRVPGRNKVRIRASLNEDGTASPAFMDAYWKAVRAEEEATRPQVRRVAEGSFQAALNRYYGSSKFKSYDPDTQRDKRGVLNRYADSAGPIALKAFRQQDVERSRDKRRDTPAAADKLVKYLRTFFAWAMKEKLIGANPAVGVEKINTGSEGHHTWSVEEIRRYEERHPVGTTARLALVLLMCTGGRRGDVYALGRQHETDGYLSFFQEKNRARQTEPIVIPIRPELRGALDATPTGDLAYIIGSHSRPYTKESFGNRFREWCDQAGLPQCSAHGVRKAAATILAENGASAMELCSIFGWSKLETAEIYVRKAQRKRLAANAFARLDAATSPKIVPLRGRKSVSGTNRRKSLVGSTPSDGGGGPGRTRTCNQTVMSGRL
ncbi:hypothetical protein GCM10008179_17550 [Hansschlegelia plantiphila]|uniref:Tyr recombinase domain-containing protein n=1 Tax=Hansschlegelia plantiphila TaxID=374655 RepID=A0A9W6IZW7_9HYPH|nr:hypothetical protein GCM10008179_17550 [Hansschlegelia plantiphila]